MVTCIALVLCFVKIKDLEGEIYLLRNELGQRYDNISTNINSIYNNVDNMLEQQASLITDEGWQFVSADMENKTVDISCSITPKEYIDGVTQAVLCSGDNEFPLTLENGSFVGEISLPLFSTTEITTISFRENGVVRNQQLNWYINPRYEYMTVVYADLNWSGTGTKDETNDNLYKWQIRDGSIYIDVDRDNRAPEIKTIHMVEKIDGVEVKRIEIPLTSSADSDKARASGLWEDTAPVVPDYPDDYTVTNITYDLTGYVFEIPFGSTLNVFVESVDGDGLVHRNQIAQWIVSE